MEKEKPARYEKKSIANSCEKYFKVFVGLAGTLAPPILKSRDSIDLVFSTHWVYPAKVPVLQPEDVQCIQKGIKGKSK